jgi:hypothetical protein
MNEGDMLYIPLGVWCSAEPQGPPSLNLTLHIENPTGAGLLVWLSEKLQRLDAFAADIPRFAGPAVKSEYLAAMRHAVVQAFRRPDLLERFHRHLNNYAPLPPAPETPWSEGGSAGRWIQLISPRRPAVRRRDHETIHIRAGGRDFPFPLDAAPLLRFLFDQAPVATAEFYAEFEGEFDRDEITEFLQVLHQAGIIGLADAEFAA